MICESLFLAVPCDNVNAWISGNVIFPSKTSAPRGLPICESPLKSSRSSTSWNAIPNSIPKCPSFLASSALSPAISPAASQPEANGPAVLPLTICK